MSNVLTIAAFERWAYALCMSESTAEGVSAEYAYTLQNQGHAFLDVRTALEYAAGHPKGAYNVPFMHRVDGKMTPNSRFVTAVCALFKLETPLLVCCQGGRRSARAVALLTEAGFTNLVDVAPGYGGVRGTFGQLVKPGWKDCDLPTEIESPGLSYAELCERVGIDR